VATKKEAATTKGRPLLLPRGEDSAQSLDRGPKSCCRAKTTNAPTDIEGLVWALWWTLHWPWSVAVLRDDYVDVAAAPEHVASDTIVRGIVWTESAASHSATNNGHLRCLSVTQISVGLRIRSVLASGEADAPKVYLRGLWETPMEMPLVREPTEVLAQCTINEASLKSISCP
jgi:hypothetical protein